MCLAGLGFLLSVLFSGMLMKPDSLSLLLKCGSVLLPLLLPLLLLLMLLMLLLMLLLLKLLLIT